VTVDAEGWVGVTTLAPDRNGALIRLKLPSLYSTPRCAYRWAINPKAEPHPEALSREECRQALGALTLDDYVKGELPSFAPPAVCQGSTAEFCRLPDAFTGGASFSADGKFGVAERIENREGPFGDQAISRFAFVLYSTAKRADIGTVEAPTNDSVRRVLATVNARDYLVVVSGGTHVAVYELGE
jgi:hypothetical protein